MEPRRRAGQPGRAGPRRPAGAPQRQQGPAGAPREEPSVPRPPRSTETGAAQPTDDAERDAVERDLDELLAETKRERDEYLELARRTKADFENYRRRGARDADEAGRRGKSSLARELVPVLDNLERALRAAGIDPEAEEPAAEDGGGLAHGVRLTYSDLRSTLERAGVEAYDPIGEHFDPTWHEALATRSEQGTEAGIVLETVEKGYCLDGQVLRPARVVVSE
jgi:molecular chaperone GrpE